MALTNLYRPGDIGLCRATETKGKSGATTPIGKAIQTAARNAGVDAHWTHAFRIVTGSGDIVENVEWETKRANISRYYGTDYKVVDTGISNAARELVVKAALKRVGQPYGKVTFASDALSALGFPLYFGKAGEEVCSQGTARDVEKGIVTFPWSLEEMLPGHLATYFKVDGVEPMRDPLGFFAKWGNAASYFADVIFG